MRLLLFCVCLCECCFFLFLSFQNHPLYSISRLLYFLFIVISFDMIFCCVFYPHTYSHQIIQFCGTYQLNQIQKNLHYLPRYFYVIYCCYYLFIYSVFYCHLWMVLALVFQVFLFSSVSLYWWKVHWLFNDINNIRLHHNSSIFVFFIFKSISDFQYLVAENIRNCNFITCHSHILQLLMTTHQHWSLLLPSFQFRIFCISFEGNEKIKSRNESKKLNEIVWLINEPSRRMKEALAFLFAL